MRILLGLSVSAAVALGACGGNVLVDGENGGAGTGGAPTTSTSSVVPTTTTAVTTTSVSTSTTTTTTAVASSSSGGPCVSTCNQAINQGGGIPPCGGTALGAYDALLSCGCSSAGPCKTACTYNFCLHQAVPPPCAMCLAANCGGNYQICTSN